MANSVDTDQTPHSAASDLGLHYLLRPICLNTKGKYGSLIYTTSSDDTIPYQSIFHVDISSFP